MIQLSIKKKYQINLKNHIIKKNIFQEFHYIKLTIKIKKYILDILDFF